MYFPDDPTVRLLRVLTMEELGREIQVILQRVNLTFAVRNRAIEDEFVGLQEAIQATLQVHSGYSTIKHWSTWTVKVECGCSPFRQFTA